VDSMRCLTRSFVFVCCNLTLALHFGVLAFRFGGMGKVLRNSLLIFLVLNG